MCTFDIGEFPANSGLVPPIGLSGNIHRRVGPTKSWQSFIKTWVNHWVNLVIRLGDIIRIQPNHIVFNNINALEDIYGHNTKAGKRKFAGSILASAKYPLSVALETLPA